MLSEKNNVVFSCRLKLIIGSVMSADCSTPQLQLRISFLSSVAYLCCVWLEHLVTGCWQHCECSQQDCTWRRSTVNIWSTSSKQTNMNMKYNIALNKQAGLEVDQEKCPSSLLPFFLPFFSSLPHPFPSRSLAPFPMCDFPISGFFAQIQLRSLASTVSSPSGYGKTPTDIRFLVLSELKIALRVIALLNKFLDDHACVMLCTGPAT